MNAERTVIEEIADYELVRLLGEGDHGHCYLAKPPPRLGFDADHVAVKVISVEAGEESFRRVGNELRLFASVATVREDLVRLLEVGRQGNKIFFSMEYCALGSLASPNRPLARADILRAIALAARGVDALHEAGLAHGGIKPSNVLLQGNGAKISEIRLAGSLSPGQSLTGIGTLSSLEYTDPGVLKGDLATRASDIWALGATLHRALSGSPLYGELPDKEPFAALKQVLSSRPQIDVAALIPDERELIDACFEPDASNRPATARALADRIEEWISRASSSNPSP